MEEGKEVGKKIGEWKGGRHEWAPASMSGECLGQGSVFSWFGRMTPCCGMCPPSKVPSSLTIFFPPFYFSVWPLLGQDSLLTYLISSLLSQRQDWHWTLFKKWFLLDCLFLQLHSFPQSFGRWFLHSVMTFPSTKWIVKKMCFVKRAGWLAGSHL
jgi:hypothetical protein